MKKIQFSSFIMISLFVVMNACHSSRESNSPTEERLIGKWNVQWVTYPEEGEELDASINYTMNGMMNIEKNGKITIHAYGYKGCIFGADTLSHTLNWVVESDTVLNLTNDGDKYGIPYAIKSIQEEKIKLQLVEDVFLFLTK